MLENKYKVNDSLPLEKHLYNILCQIALTDIMFAKMKNIFSIETGRINIGNKKIYISRAWYINYKIRIMFFVKNELKNILIVEGEEIDIDKIKGLYYDSKSKTL